MSANLVLPVAALAFCTWAVYMGSLASIQYECNSVNGEPAIYGPYITEAFGACYSMYSFWWFIMSFEFLLIVGVGVAAAAGSIRSTKMSFLGLFSVATLLYIMASQGFYASLTTDNTGYWQSGTPLNKLRTIVAGSIMTAVANGIMVFVLGIEEEVIVKEVVTVKTETA